LTVFSAVVYNSYGARLVYSTDRNASVNMPKRREENRISLLAAVNLNPK